MSGLFMTSRPLAPADEGAGTVVAAEPPPPAETGETAPNPVAASESGPAVAEAPPAAAPEAGGERKGPVALLRELVAPAAEASTRPDEALPRPPEPAAPAIAQAPEPERAETKPAEPKPAEAASPGLPGSATVAEAPAGPVATGSIGRGRRIGTGKAVWYEHPGRTASGERFNPNALTAAHRSLPFGTRVRVVNARTKRSVVVRINDRGPSSRRFVIDLSRQSARQIGLEGVDHVALYLAE